MATLSVSKTYSDDTLLSASDIDAIVDSVETFVNTTRLNDDNINADSITASSKFKTASITSAKFANEAVTSAKIADSAVTTDKIADLAITGAKIAGSSLLRNNFYQLAPLAYTGTVIMFHTFNGAVSVPRGWMKCNGDTVVESAYESLHGAGSYEEDGIADSPILGLFLPDMVDKYAKGTSDTTEAGGVAIEFNGNLNNTIDIEHTHTIPDHAHNFEHFFGGQNSGTSGAFYRFRAAIANDDYPEVIDDSVSTELSSTQDIRPESIEFIFIMKVI